ncbi:uncharacterized protein METZ01_LOCUS155900 [marine metagenome]|uniref:Uncharacterized protein n=1 Tax=marine metagenome TaxID=408172 RepID=A0A382ANK6_9ZZZZ
MKIITLCFCFIFVFSWAQGPEKASVGQKNAITTLAGQKGLDSEALNSLVMQRYNLNLYEISKEQAAELITEFQSPNSTLNTQNKQNNTSQSLVLAEILEVGMAKKFHLRDGNIIHGSITEIIDGECKITTKEGILTIPMTDILEETVDLTKHDEARYKGPLLKEDRTSIVLRSNYGDVNINKKDIKKMDRYHGGKLIPWVENKKEFYQGEAQLTSVFLDPTAFPLDANTFYISGLSIGYGFTDRFMVTTQFGSNFNGDLNLNPKMRFLHKKTSDRESAMTWGLGFHRAYPIQKVVSKYSHAWKFGGTEITLNDSSEFSLGNLGDYVSDQETNVLVEAYLVYSSRRENPTGRGKVGYSVGVKTSNMFYLIEDSYANGNETIEFDKDNWQFKVPFRAWISFEYDLQKKLKFVGSMWADNSSRTLDFEEVVEDYFGDEGESFSLDSMSGKYSMFDFDFGFLYAINNNFRLGVHFQQPYIDIYWEFFEF